jgi:hypothetical protein
MLVRFYGRTVVASVVFGALIFAFAAPRLRETLVVLVAMLFISIGALFTGYLYAQRLEVSGAKPWAKVLVLVSFVLLPAALLYALPRLGPFVLLLSLLSFVFLARESENSADAR